MSGTPSSYPLRTGRGARAPWAVRTTLSCRSRRGVGRSSTRTVSLMIRTADEVAGGVRAGTLNPVRITEEALERISARDDTIGAFRRVRAAEALAEARAVGARPDLADLPLAGVPIAVKDVVAVAGEYAEWGSRAGSRQVAGADGEIVTRLRAAGAVIVGLSRVPELCCWASTDTAEGIARNPA